MSGMLVIKSVEPMYSREGTGDGVLFTDEKEVTGDILDENVVMGDILGSGTCEKADSDTTGKNWGVATSWPSDLLSCALP